MKLPVDRLNSASLCQRGVLLIILSFFLAAGCRRGRGTASRQQSFDQASIAFLQGQYHQAGEKYRLVASRGGRDRLGRQAMYWLGMCLVQRGLAKEAELWFDRARRAGCSSDLHAQILMGLAQAAILQGHHEQALHYYQELLRNHAGDCDQAQVLAAMYRCHLEESNSVAAARVLRELNDRHPDSPFTQGLASRPDPGITYTVQAGAFLQEMRARDLTRQLKQRGFDCLISRRNTRKGILHVVQVGAFSQRPSAEKRVQELRAAGFSAAVRTTAP